MIGSFSNTSFTVVTRVALAAGLLTMAVNATAQQSMTVDELEAYIAEKKAKLTEALDQRDATLEKQAELDKKRAEQEARQQKLEEELRTLCEDREATEPGTLDACLEEMDLASN